MGTADDLLKRRETIPRLKLFVRLFHRTNEAAAGGIVETGWIDNANGSWPAGVFLSNYPVDRNEGAKGPVLFEVNVRIDARTLFSDFEIIETGKPYREFVIPAAVLNDRGQCEYRRLNADDEANAMNGEHWNEYPPGEPDATYRQQGEEVEPDEPM